MDETALDDDLSSRGVWFKRLECSVARSTEHRANQFSHREKTIPANSTNERARGDALQHFLHLRSKMAEEKITFAAQDDLPSLPVPDLEQTLEKYIQSVKVS